MQQDALLVEVTENHSLVCHRPNGLEWQEWALATWSKNVNDGFMVGDPDTNAQGGTGPVFYDVLRKHYKLPVRKYLTDKLVHAILN